MPTNQRPGQARILGIITDCRIPWITKLDNGDYNAGYCGL
jgi:hypothetical protein